LVDALASTGSPAVLPLLNEALAHDGAIVRRVAARAIERLTAG
jgi:HEAT repeat protein